MPRAAQKEPMKPIVSKSSVSLLFAAFVLATSVPASAEDYTFTTRAGLAGSTGSTDGTASLARFNRPSGVAVDSAGNVYVADTYNHTIRKMTPGRVVTTLAGLAVTSARPTPRPARLDGMPPTRTRRV